MLFISEHQTLAFTTLKSIGRQMHQSYYTVYISYHCKWVPCHHGMARPQVADRGDGLKVWRVGVNILTKQSWTADRGWPSSMGAGRGC
jgi:hypothetical protein